MTMFDRLFLPHPSPTVQLLTIHSLLLVSIILLAQRNLEKWTATRRMVPPLEEKSEVDEEDHSAKGSEAQVARTADQSNRIRRFLATSWLPYERQGEFARHMGIHIGTMAVFITVPRFLNRFGLDLLWGSIMTLFTAVFLFVSTELIIPFAREYWLDIPKKPKAKDCASMISFNDDQLKLQLPIRIPLAILLSLANTYACYCGDVLFTLAIPATWLIFLSTLSTIYGQSIRRLTKLVGLWCAVTVVLYGAMTAYLHFYPSKPNPTSQRATTSPWLQPLLTTFFHVLPYWLPTMLLCTTYRFEYQMDRMAPVKAEPGQRVVVHSLPTPSPLKTPIFYSGLAGLAGAALIMILLASHLEVDPFKCESVMCWLQPLAAAGVILGQGLTAWMKGSLPDWWKYNETWIPSYKKDQNVHATVSEKE